VRDYRAALKAFERAGLPLERARTAIGMLDALMNLARYDEALALARWTRRVFLAAGEERRASRLDVNLANLEMRRDRPDLALARYRAAERVFEQRGDSMDLALTRQHREPARRGGTPARRASLQSSAERVGRGSEARG
jgi:tetratricopeptide (TPR) repeat protein